MPQNPINHLDREWRFQDVDLSAQAASGTLKLRFELQADQGSQFGGWTMDDVCVVYEGVGPGPLCGNGTVDPGEQCDDGNTADGDGCSSICQTDDGTGGGDDGDDTGGKGGGCCSTGTGPASALALSVLTLGLMLRRRRTVSIDTE